MVLDDFLLWLKRKNPQAVLDAVKSPEAAQALKPEQREIYLKALTEVYGPMEARAELSGKDLARIKQRLDTFKLINNLGLEYHLDDKTPSVDVIRLSARNYRGQPVESIGKLIMNKDGYNDVEFYGSDLLNKGLYRKFLEDYSISIRPAKSKHFYRNEFSNKTWDRIISEGYGVRVNGVDEVDPKLVRSRLNRSPEAAFDPRFKDSKNILAGVAAAPMVSMDPLEHIGAWFNAYDEVKNKFADKLTERTSFVQPDETLKAMGRMAFDPMNLVDGPLAIGLVAADLASNKKQDKKTTNWFDNKIEGGE